MPTRMKIAYELPIERTIGSQGLGFLQPRVMLLPVQAGRLILAYGTERRGCTYSSYASCLCQLMTYHPLLFSSRTMLGDGWMWPCCGWRVGVIIVSFGKLVVAGISRVLHGVSSSFGVGC